MTILNDITEYNNRTVTARYSYQTKEDKDTL